MPKFFVFFLLTVQRRFLCYSSFCLFMRWWFRIWRLFCHCLLLISSFAGAAGFVRMVAAGFVRVVAAGFVRIVAAGFVILLFLGYIFTAIQRREQYF